MFQKNRKLIEEWLDRAQRQEAAAKKWPPESYWHKQGLADCERSLNIAAKLEAEDCNDRR